jgi:UDP-N-acetylmuramate dehydrogenase
VNAARGELAQVAAALGARAEADHPLGALTTYRVGGPAALWVEAETEDDLLAVRRALAGTAVAVLVVGKGSNLLVADAGFAGLAVRLGPGLSAIAVGEGEPGAGSPVEVGAGGGAGLPVLARRSVEAGLTGLEWAVGVPGSVGGAVRMNAGGHGSDTAACLLRYRWMDLLSEDGGEEGPERLAFSYRSSSISPSQVVLEATFGLRRGDPETGRAELSEIVRWRRQHQPGGSNAGSVFTNPPGDSAGRLVEAAGLKGFALGTARVSEKHANFIQAADGGSADDVRRLTDHVAAVVAERFGVVLTTEVRLVGFGATDNGGVQGGGEALGHDAQGDREGG